MNRERWQKIRNLFDAVQEISPDERAKFLDENCADDEDLRVEVEKLLASFDDAESFLENPVAAEALSLFEDKKTLVETQTTGNPNSEKLVAGTILASRYRIIGLLGKGGMGEVYKAEDIKLDQIVALKFLPDKLEKDKSALNGFIGEVRTARQVSHGNVCRVFDIGEIDGRHFLSMEYIDGDDLSSLLRRVGRLSSERAIEISRQLCVGLHAIHDAGILHRDLKPANIIIDSKGKARITDFGIAGFAEDVLTENLRVGTPAYMSPEQISGENVSVKSDIYALGLVLYEIFTGKQAFSSDSIPDLMRKHRDETPTDPSEFVKGIDPLVENVIFQCLEKNPANRPPSALYVAMALPGGNPLQVALEAGETPSPEMVAAAPKKGALKPLVGFGLLIVFCALFLLMAVFNHKYKTYNVAPFKKSPEILAEKSRDILQKLGYTDAPLDSSYRFEVDNSFIDYSRRHKMSPGKVREMLSFGQPFELYFLYRQSPNFLEPKESGNITENEPPLTTANMINIKLDARGRLFEFAAVPPKTSEQYGKTKIDWNVVFTEAGLDILKFKEVETNFTPPFYADEKRIWEGTFADLPEIPIRIKAAAFNGKLVYFHINTPWNNPEDENALHQTASWRAGVFLMIGIYCLVIIGSISLARQNIKAGRGDLKGALKLTIFLFSIYFTGKIIYADHVPTVWGELSVLYQIFADSLIYTLFIALIYIALEPFVRRYWSELLISWNRLLAGDFRDPLIGRDILVGGLLGIGHTLGIYLGEFIIVWVSNADGIINDDYWQLSINGYAAIIAVVTDFIANSVLFGFIMLFVLLGVYMLSKRKSLSIFLIFLLFFSIQILLFVITHHWAFVFSAVFISACYAAALGYFGLLGSISFWICFPLSYLFPVTFNTANLYFPNTVITFILIFTLAIYAFYISIAGQKLFQTKKLADDDNF